ncbi:RNase A-like domain-containing protein [Streptomyces sp. NPDC008313]|uniref:RNase A-like domain-containing protein n=1 Tax=Streptomyces sp. NPDC008313 TaxID=3364826 RepID=UPI0036E046C4
MATPPPPAPSPSASPSAGDTHPAPGPSGKEPDPSPGTSPDPDYEPPPPPPTGYDGRPSDARRKWEREQLKQPAPDSGGRFDVRTGHVYYTSALVRDEQFAFHKVAAQLVEDVHHRQAAGNGSGADDFAKAYGEVAKAFLDVWAKGVASIGGVSFGLTNTANNYAAADWHSRGLQGPPPRRDAPIGVGDVTYGPVASIEWTGTGDGTDTDFLAGIGEVPDFLADLIKPAIEDGLRLGKTHEITPGAETGNLRSIGDTWAAAGKSAQKSADNFTDCIAYLTDGSDSEWQGAMNAFCQSIWGTTAWGGKWDADGKAVPPKQPGGRDWRTNFKERPSARRPIIEVLKQTGDEMKKAFDAVADAADRCRETTQHLAMEATKATLRDLVPDSFSWEEFTKMTAVLTAVEITAVFRAHMDKSGADRAVEACHKAFHEGADQLRKLLPELAEASLSAPRYEAEEARAEAFGARSLNEFKPEHKWSTPGNAARGSYQLDLASTEWLENSHTISKHVALTDDQLAQRLRDDLKKPPRPGSDWPYGQPKVGNASTFKDLDSAQKMTQYNLDRNADVIQTWIAEEHPKKGDRIDVTVAETPYGHSGRSIDKEEMKRDPFPADKAEFVDGVETRLVYNEDLDPPFTVMTSMPKKVSK